MPRIDTPDAVDASAELRAPLHFVNKRFGFIPGIYQIISISPQVFRGVTGLQAALARALDGATREGIALAVSEVNRSRYCLAAHVYLGANFAKLAWEEMAVNRLGSSFEPKPAAAVEFAVKVVRLRGKIRDEDLAAIRSAGYKDVEIVEIIGLCAET